MPLSKGDHTCEPVVRPGIQGTREGIPWCCYMKIPSESARDQEWKIKGRKHIQLIAIDYCSATGTAGMRCQKNEG